MSWRTSIPDRRVSAGGLLFLVAALLLLGGCRRATGEAVLIHGDPLYSPERAVGFEVRQAWPGSASSVLVSRNPWQGADSVTGRLVVLRDGEQLPPNWHVPALRDEARRIVCMSSTHVAMLDALGLTDRIVGVSGLPFINSESLRRRAGEVADVGYEASVDFERLMGLRPDLVLLYGVDGANPIEPKLRELGIPYAYIGEYLEDDPVGRAEWLVALAELTGGRQAGVAAWQPVRDSYDTLRAGVARRTAGRDRPAVMLNAPYGGNWYVPSAGSYAVRLIEDAGGECVAVSRLQGTASATISLEEAYGLLAGADFWLAPGQAATMAELARMCPKMMDVRAVRQGRVYNSTARVNAGGGNDYWESGAVNPHLVLADLVAILHPELGATDGTLTYYERVR